MPPQWVGLKFFNVFGPNEYHKGAMMSLVARRFDDAKAGRPVRLFKSYRQGIADGEQKRDFIYVDDAVAGKNLGGQNRLDRAGAGHDDCVLQGAGRIGADGGRDSGADDDPVAQNQTGGDLPAPGGPVTNRVEKLPVPRRRGARSRSRAACASAAV